MSERGPLTMKPAEYCTRFYAWVDLAKEHIDGFATALPPIKLAVEKSCLLSRMIYAGEMPSQTPCPVHQGHWSGIQLHPGDFWENSTSRVPVTPDQIGELAQAAFDAGCRCFRHRGCNCTTGWQPDEHCGCVV